MGTLEQLANIIDHGRRHELPAPNTITIEPDDTGHMVVTLFLYGSDGHAWANSITIDGTTVESSLAPNWVRVISTGHTPHRRTPLVLRYVTETVKS